MIESYKEFSKLHYIVAQHDTDIDNRVGIETMQKYKSIILAKLNDAVVYFILLLGLTVTSSLASDGAAEVSFTYLQNRPAVYISVNDSDPLLVILDTGLGRGLMLDNSVAQNLKLTALEKQTVDNLGMGQLTLQRYQSSLAKLGDFTFTIENINGDENLNKMLNMMGKDTSGNRPVGVLSLWAFNELAVTLDLTKNILGIDREKILESQIQSVVKYRHSDRLPIFSIDINNQSYSAHLDSGSPAPLILPYSMVKNFEYHVEPTIKGRAMTAGKKHTIWAAKLKGKISFAGIVLDEPNVLFMDGLPQVNVGLAFFKQAKLTFDTKNHLLQVRPSV